MVRRFIISKDGSVDAGIAQFVKWAMRVVAIFFITQEAKAIKGFFSSKVYLSIAQHSPGPVLKSIIQGGYWKSHIKQFIHTAWLDQFIIPARLGVRCTVPLLGN